VRLFIGWKTSEICKDFLPLLGRGQRDFMTCQQTHGRVIKIGIELARKRMLFVAYFYSFYLFYENFDSCVISAVTSTAGFSLVNLFNPIWFLYMTPTSSQRSFMVQGWDFILLHRENSNTFFSPNWVDTLGGHRTPSATYQ